MVKKLWADFLLKLALIKTYFVSLFRKDPYLRVSTDENPPPVREEPKDLVEQLLEKADKNKWDYMSGAPTEEMEKDEAYHHVLSACRPKCYLGHQPVVDLFSLRTYLASPPPRLFQENMGFYKTLQAQADSRWMDHVRSTSDPYPKDRKYWTIKHK